MPTRLDSLAAIAAHRREQGDLVEVFEAPPRLLAGTTFHRAPTVGEVRWLEGVTIVMAMLPLECPPHALDALEQQVLLLNATSATPGFVLKQLPDGVRVAFVAYAFRDEDGAHSAHAFDEVLRIARDNAATHLPRFAARVAEASEPSGQRELPSYGRVDPRLDGVVMDAIRDAVRRDAPPFAKRLGNAMIAELEQTFFEKTRVFEIVSPSPLPARTFYVALAPDDRVHVLSGRRVGIDAIIALDPPMMHDGKLTHFVDVVTA